MNIWDWEDEKITKYLEDWAKERGLKLPIQWNPTKHLADVWICVNEIAYIRPHIEGRQTRDEGVNFSNTMAKNHWDLWNGCKEAPAARIISTHLIYAIEKAKNGIIV